jgi:hypothetical protein
MEVMHEWERQEMHTTFCSIITLEDHLRIQGIGVKNIIKIDLAPIDYEDILD